MPRETIRRLQRDVERVLVAGAHLAAADSDLAKDRKALDDLATQLGAKAPVLGQLAAATGKAITAGAKDAARELVSLATMTAQVRCAQAAPAPAPATQPLAVRPLVGTPCKAKDLAELYNALVESGKGRMEKLDQAVERGDIADLRLVDALIFAMHDSWIGEKVATHAIPKLGPAIIAPIRAQLRFANGQTVDGRRLRALVAVQRSEARDLLKAALTEGNGEMREAAFDAIADHVRGEPEFEALVLQTVEKERSGGVRRSALRALAGYASDASLAALVEALDDERTRDAAAEGLSASKHPKAITWMLTRLDEAVAAALEAAKAAKKKKKDEAAATAAPVKTPKSLKDVEPAVMVQTLLAALAEQRDPRIAVAALALVPDYGVHAARAVLPNGDAKQLAALADLLAGTDEELYRVAAKAALALGADEAFKRFTATFTANDREKKIGLARLEAVASAIEGNRDSRWSDFALKQLDGPMMVAVHAFPVLVASKDKRAVKPLLKLLGIAKTSDLIGAIIETLGAIGDPSAIAPILAHYTGKDHGVRYRIRDAIIAIDDVSAVDQVRTIVVGLKNSSGYEHWYLRSLLDHLEKRFPGK
jgi:HEAT repeat protein